MPLIHEGPNPYTTEHVAGIPPEETARLKRLNDTEPSGVLAVSDDLDPDRGEGSELTFVHGVATTGAAPAGLDVLEVPAGTWAATVTTWFPSQPWRLRSGPEIVAVLAHDPEVGTATCELWLPVERG